MSMISRRTARFVVAGALLLGCGTGSREPALPRTIQLGKSVEELRPLLAEDCRQTEEMHFTGALAAPFNEQTQINCSDLEVFGSPRQVEFMFDDGPLGHVWILIDDGELQQIRQTLERAFGKVVHETATDQVFASRTVALRSSPPEILIATPDLLADLTEKSQRGR